MPDYYTATLVRSHAALRGWGGQYRRKIERLEWAARPVLELAERITELEAQIEAVWECQRYYISASMYADGAPGIEITTDNPSGEWLKTADVLAALEQNNG